MDLSELEEGSVFLDTNILLYAYTTTRFSSSCETLLEKMQTKDIAGYINSTVVDEFFHKASSLRCILRSISHQGKQLSI